MELIRAAGLPRWLAKVFVAFEPIAPTSPPKGGSNLRALHERFALEGRRLVLHLAVMEPASVRPWKAIAAMAENRVIGNRGRIPWHLPEDFKWVKQCTAGQAIAMGRKTFESLGRPLPNRENIVITRSTTAIPDCIVLPSLDALQTHQTEREIWIFGGAEIYRQALPLVSDLYLTVVRGTFEGDAFFPPFEHLFDAPETIREAAGFEIRHYRTQGACKP